MDSVQVCQPDTCTCLVHQAVDTDLPAGQRVLRYVTYAEAVEIHVRHFWARPESTNYRIWWSVPRKSKPGRQKSPKRIIALVQPHPRLCPHHAHLGYSQEMYETVLELNVRKNQARSLAWEVANDINDEDLAWVALATDEPILRHRSGRPYVTSEREERRVSLSRVFPPEAVEWEVRHPGEVVVLKYLRDWLPRSQADAIQAACNGRFGVSKVWVS